MLGRIDASKQTQCLSFPNSENSEKSSSAFFTQVKDFLKMKRLAKYIVLEGATCAIVSLYVGSFASNLLSALTSLRAVIQ